MSLYRYFGLVFGRVRVTVALDSAFLPDPGDHAAVWAGVSTRDALAWVQGGVEQTQGDDQPHAYIEAGAGGEQILFRRWPVAHGQPVLVRLERRRHAWRVRVADHVSPYRPLLVPATVDATLETLGRHASAVARIGRKRIRS